MRQVISSSKIQIPPVPTGSLPRNALLERLNTGRAGKLTCVSAPIGYGKTTLIANWVVSTGLPCAWVTLDELDNDPQHFVNDLKFSLAKACGAPAAGLAEQAIPPSEGPLTPEIRWQLDALLADLWSLSTPLLVVLDDFHLIQAEQISAILQHLLACQPAQMHLVLISRAELPIPLGLLRVQRNVHEITALDLRFSIEEAAAFLNQFMDLGLEDQDIIDLEKRTEGWVAGLQLAAISIQGLNHPRQVIENLPGSQGFLSEYLLEEVWHRQPPDVQEFLLQTGVLYQFNEKLCAELTGSQNCAAILAYLVQSNLFLQTLDSNRTWFRYHGLFADWLRSMAKKQHPTRYFALLAKASRWYEANGLLAEAISAALVSGSFDRVAQLVSHNCFSLIYHGELSLVRRLLETIPETVYAQFAWLNIGRAWVLAYSGQVEAAALQLDEIQARQAALSAGMEPAEYHRFAGQILTIRAYCALLSDRLEECEQQAQQALAILPEEERFTRAFAVLLGATVAGQLGRLSQALHDLNAEVNLQRQSGDQDALLIALAELPVLQIFAGQHHAAEATCQEIILLADEYQSTHGRMPSFVAFAYCRLSSIYLEWYELEKAERYAQMAVDLGLRWGQRDILCIAHLCMFQARLVDGRQDQALTSLQTVESLAQGVLPYYEQRVPPYWIKYYLAIGHPAVAARLVQGHNPLSLAEMTYAEHRRYLLFSQVFIAQVSAQPASQADAQSIAQAVAQAGQLAKQAGALLSVVQARILQSELALLAGDLLRAKELMCSALQLAKKEHYIRVFVEQGERAAEILRLPDVQASAPAYTARLLKAFGPAPQSTQSPPSQTAVPKQDPGVNQTQGLTRREIEVLHWLQQGEPDKRIAEHMAISLGTAQMHLKNIYRKLDVHNRTSAVAAAQKLGLI